MLPLSMYFRTELTSILTLRRPANRMDTLKKLEDALERREVAPCVVEQSAYHNDLVVEAESELQPSLMHKLHLAFKRHGDGGLVKDVEGCLQCAQRPDRVCYGAVTWYNPPRFDEYTNVQPFVERLRMELTGLAMPKFLEVYKPMRRLLLAAEEQGLFNFHAQQQPDIGEEEQEGSSQNFTAETHIILDSELEKRLQSEGRDLTEYLSTFVDTETEKCVVLTEEKQVDSVKTLAKFLLYAMSKADLQRVDIIMVLIGLGSTHDGDPASLQCPPNSGHVMSPKAEGDIRLEFSECSKAAISSYVT
ncbi:hypothetical protein HPB50_005657 [Hyalomma asiaticum]|uniref:Uncharacterized protein n=1 Tax=Hyalomma asiaticum TaxID=266040 RepID=A0ACB7RS56_HYAAI|nr:hypothetical protein HPB50_005657 [Hyalomma asiaticum]